MSRDDGALQQSDDSVVPVVRWPPLLRSSWTPRIPMHLDPYSVITTLRIGSASTALMAGRSLNRL